MLQSRERALPPGYAMAYAGAPLDGRNAFQESEHGALSPPSMGLEGLRTLSSILPQDTAPMRLQRRCYARSTHGSHTMPPTKPHLPNHMLSLNPSHTSKNTPDTRCSKAKLSHRILHCPSIYFSRVQDTRFDLSTSGYLETLRYSHSMD